MQQIGDVNTIFNLILTPDKPIFLVFRPFNQGPPQKRDPERAGTPPFHQSS